MVDQTKGIINFNFIAKMDVVLNPDVELEKHIQDISDYIYDFIQSENMGIKGRSTIIYMRVAHAGESIPEEITVMPTNFRGKESIDRILAEIVIDFDTEVGKKVNIEPKDICDIISSSILQGIELTKKDYPLIENILSVVLYTRSCSGRARLKVI